MKKQFTLIELLVVIAIIAILAAILLPALNSARERGLAINCMSVSNNIGKAIMFYRNDWNDHYISHDQETYSNDMYALCYKLAKEKYLGDTNSPEMYMCPSSVGRFRKYWAFTLGALGYANPSVCGKYAFNLKAHYVQKFGYAKLGMVGDTARVSDSDDTQSDGSPHTRVPLFATKKYALPYAKHNNTANVVFADGHSAAVTGEQFFSEVGRIGYYQQFRIPNIHATIHGPVGGAFVTKYGSWKSFVTEN